MIDKCEDFSYLLNDYLDKNLDTDQIESLEQHLANCKSCKQELKELKEIVETVNQLKDITIPEAKETFASDIIAQLKADNKPARISYFKYIAASVIAVSIVSLAVVNFTQPKTTSISQNNVNTITEEEYDDYFSDFTEEQDTFLIAEAGFPTDEYGLIDLDGIITDD